MMNTIGSSTILSTLLVLVVASCYPACVAPFLIRDASHTTANFPVAQSRAAPILTALAASETNDGHDEYDDFYDDFDPSDYEIYDKGSQSSFDDYQYTRDADVDNSQVDVEAVNNLISKRSEMRMARQYDDADKLLDDLLENFGVLVRDKDRKWRTGCSQNEIDSNWLYQSSKQGGGSSKNRKDFGPNGHDYVYASDAGPSIASISEEKINELLAQLLSFKFSRDYDGADAIQVELLSAGVVVDGKARKWRADGKYFSNFAPNKYQMSPHAYDVSGDLDEIEKLMSERALARAERLFKRSDEIRDELLKRFNVRINDKLLLWSVGGEQTWGKTYEPFTMSDRSEVPSDVQWVEKLIKERDLARGNRDFVTADKIRRQLLDENIAVDDKKRIWYVSRTTKTSGKNVLNSRDLSPCTRRGDSPLSPGELNEIENLVNERDEHKRKKRYQNADAIRSQLLKNYGVKVDDNAREWYIAGTEYRMAQNVAAMDEETRSKIEQKIQARTLARGERDYEKADTIKKELYATYNVGIDDNVKEWYVVKKKKKSW
mmetsp:Transcript_16634/g.34222  ORF Transcript_16634/g.34222 Transcript_16634/m.34222 type:complete len:546 (+) Transcript_16634:269-1906(+)